MAREPIDSRRDSFLSRHFVVNDATGDPFTENIRRPGNATRLLETLVLLGVAPFLLFPETLPFLTLLALLLLILLWLRPLLVDQVPGIPITPFNISLLIVGLSVIVGVLVTADPDLTLQKASGVILGLAAWRFLAIYGREPKVLRWATAAFLLLALAFTLFSLLGLEVTLKIPFLAAFLPSRYVDFKDLIAFSIHPNQLAGLISLYLPLLLSLLLAWRPVSHSFIFRGVLGVFLILALTSLVLTQSRGGWIGALAGVVVLLFLWAIILPPSRARLLSRLSLGAVLLIVLATFFWLGPEQLQTLWLNPPEETAVGTLTTLNYRKDLWPWALTAVGDFPLTGTGLGTFREVAFRLYPLPLSPLADIGHAHNIFLQTSLDLGIPGLIGYVSLLLVALAAGWAIAQQNKVLRPISLGLVAGLAGLHVFGLADALALGAKPAVLFWVALGLIAAMSNYAPGTTLSEVGSTPGDRASPNPEETNA